MTAPLLTIDDVAQTLGISRWKAYELARVGALQVVRVGACIRVTRQALDAFIETGGTGHARD